MWSPVCIVGCALLRRDVSLSVEGLSRKTDQAYECGLTKIISLHTDIYHNQLCLEGQLDVLGMSVKAPDSRLLSPKHTIAFFMLHAKASMSRLDLYCDVPF